MRGEVEKVKRKLEGELKVCKATLVIALPPLSFCALSDCSRQLWWAQKHKEWPRKNCCNVCKLWKSQNAYCKNFNFAQTVKQRKLLVYSRRSKKTRLKFPLFKGKSKNYRFIPDIPLKSHHFNVLYFVHSHVLRNWRKNLRMRGSFARGWVRAISK